MADPRLTPRPKKLFINTIGCQMNVYDSDQIRRVLAPLGYESTECLEDADLVIANTCTIRAKAEQKAFSFLGRLAELKKRNPHVIAAMGGCVAQQEGRRVLERMHHVDLVFGTQAIGRLPMLVQRIESDRCRLVDTELDAADGHADNLPVMAARGAVSRFVTIMHGCDNYCTYCVVPYVRGREVSRHPDAIVSEIEKLVRTGVKEVVLLGQNVNSYGQGGACRFPELLARIDAIAGLLRIRFTTSHPKDLSPPLINTFAHLDKLCPHIHLPVQSGADAVLKRMNRRYTRQDYLEKIDALRRVRPDIAISSDFIVGFPGETEADFQQTLSLMKTVGYDSCFAFKYSDRPFAPAARFRNKVAETDKKDRLARLLDLQQGISSEKNQACVGKTASVLVEGGSKKDRQPADDRERQWSGHALDNRIVNFAFDPVGDGCANPDLTGLVIDVQIQQALAHSLWGRADNISGRDDHAA